MDWWQVVRPKKLYLTNYLAPGDVLVMTAAIEMLHRQMPGGYITTVNTTAMPIWENNPHVTPASDNLYDDTFEMEHPLINHSAVRLNHYIEGYVAFLSERLELYPDLYLDDHKPFLYLSDKELAFQSPFKKPEKRLCIVNAGVKEDYTAKGWGHAKYQAVVNELCDVIEFVQIGESHHIHQPLENAVNLIGETTTRELIVLCSKADFGLGPTTFIQHIFAAFEKPYFCLLGGREPVQWVQYPKQTTFHSVGSLPCCEREACWRAKTVSLEGSDNSNLCFMPNLELKVPECMARITVAEVVAAIRRIISCNAM